jgi:hypothetical protein
MIGVEAEVNKHRSCKDRNELERLIREYKELALQHATNLVVAGQYTTVALKLQEICDRLPAPNLRNVTAGNKQEASVKTAAITNEENARINNAWKQRTGNSPSGTKR